MKNLILVGGDIIENAHKYNIEAIVNPANKYMDYGSGVCWAIYDKAGRYDLRDKDAKELGLIQEFIPKEPSEQVIEELIAELMEAATLTIKDTKGVIADVQRTFPTAQKGTIVKIFKSLL